MKLKLFVALIFAGLCSYGAAHSQSWIRINQLGYTPGGKKIAVWGGKEGVLPKVFELVDPATTKVVFKASVGKNFGAYGPFKNTFRLNFTGFNRSGYYYLRTGETRSPDFRIDKDVYAGSADFLLNYMRQQQCGFNPHTKDSCHTHDGFTLYGPMPDSTHIDVTGGWHDASDYLQYSTTSANATYHLLAAYKDFPRVFSDEYEGNGLKGRNKIQDVLDMAKWGLDWLIKMNPRDDWMFNQIADDRDHQGMRMPLEDSFYGKGFERPVYFCSGEPQIRQKFMNNTKGVASTAGKFSSAFALGYKTFKELNPSYADFLYKKILPAYNLGLQKPGNHQTASVKSPYIYAEDNWTDDMELAAAELYSVTKDRKHMDQAIQFARKEKITPWLGKDTANHYQWYPFINMGHFAVGSQSASDKNEVTGYYKKGIDLVQEKARKNAFNRGIPFIWCSNNLTTAFAIQCLFYEKLSGDRSYNELMQSNIDWLFGCNPWGTSMVYGWPAWGDTPVDPHAAFSKIGGMHVNGGLVDGPVYTNIYKNLIGIRLVEPDEYAEFQNELAVYHDDYGDYSTNEPTMDGTASLIYLMAALENANNTSTEKFERKEGAIVRGDTLTKKIALVFTGDEFADGARPIINTLQKEKIKASFFFTGRFYDNPEFKNTIIQLKQNGNYLGPHSDNHLLYCDWANRDSLLVTYDLFKTDLEENYDKMKKFGVAKEQARYFIPPYEWYNSTISEWTKSLGLQLVNFSAGTISAADYTTPDMKRYRSSKEILDNILAFERTNGLNGFILLSHVGVSPQRTDKFYTYLPQLTKLLKQKGYQFVKIDELLKN